MATSFDYSITTDFPNQAVDLSVLTAEIEAAGPGLLDSIDVDGDTVTVNTTTDLTGPQETALDGVIAAHQGDPFVEGIQREFQESEQTETTTTFTTKATLTSGLLKAGDYEINWYGECSVLTNDGTSGCLVSVLWNGTERASAVNDLEFYSPFGGSVPVTVSDLATPSLEVQIRRVGTANTARVRRIRLAIIPIPADLVEE